METFEPETATEAEPNENLPGSDNCRMSQRNESNIDSDNLLGSDNYSRSQRDESDLDSCNEVRKQKFEEIQELLEDVIQLEESMTGK